MSNIDKPRKGEKLSEKELDGIAGGVAWTRGTNEDDIMLGTDGDDKLDGRGGDDFLSGGDGNDTIDGGWRDGADDVALGGDGDDMFTWGLTKDGSDTFIGGEGTDTLRLDLESASSHLRSVYEAGSFDIQLLDSDGHPLEITDDMWDAGGNLTLPPGTSGIITGATGETMTFSGVERIQGF